MIIKRNLKSQMPALKRCKTGDVAGEDDESAQASKKRKTNGYYHLNLLGDVAAGVIPGSFHGLLSGGVEKGFSAYGGVESKGGGVPAKKDQVQRPPLVRTSRGRVQVLPSRFKDSVIDNWRKDGKNSLPDCEVEDEVECKVEKFSFRAAKTCNQNARKGRNDERIGYKARKYSALCGDEVGPRFRSFGARKDSNLRGALASRREVLVEDEKGRFLEVDGVDLMEDDGVLKENGEKKDGLYGPEDFYAGDIVWAKAGRKEPFWPAIVIDPMKQAPELVMRSCIPDAACVMFLGYAGNENQRVRSILTMV